MHKQISTHFMIVVLMRVVCVKNIQRYNQTFYSSSSRISFIQEKMMFMNLSTSFNIHNSNN